MHGLFSPTHQRHRSETQTDLFAPVPRFPTASETIGRMTDSGAVGGLRKRTRNNSDVHSTLSSTSQIQDSTAWENSSLAYSRFSDARSPPPLAHDRYALAGGMERPHVFARQNRDNDDYFHLQHQRGRWSIPSSPAVRAPDQIDHSLQTTPSMAKPWMISQILSMVGGVAGKFVQFCSVPFKGFQAGGGQAYTFTAQGDVAANNNQDFLFGENAPARVRTPLPGGFPEDNYGVLSIESVESERPKPKRLKTGENWVMVDNDLTTISRPGTPRLSERRVPNHTRSPSQIPRPVSRASFATPNRPSLIPVSRRSTMDRKSFTGSKQNNDGNTTPRSYSRQSYGSPAMFKEKRKVASPLPPESQRLINKIKREEFEDEARMRRMSSQMSDMLREAREALGSKFEVEDDDLMSGNGVHYDDDGYADEPLW
ncbi:hypothetical protein B0J11DRAFT_438005 [Dendryphion nanum]|uniref:Uncharacterized protein n=1 Tax=Dendryphion nanum TaxID=256645 RepID=A0A9P9IJ68_9PLEO|nr:hypothetical protein B0J11DRAFT_438005 [Dendryphion nanum]